jgi:hypothetical protein
LLSALFLLPVAFYYQRDDREYDRIEVRLERFAGINLTPRRVSSRHAWLLDEEH